MPIIGARVTLFAADRGLAEKMKKRTLLTNAQLPPPLDVKLATVLIVVALVGLPATGTEPEDAIWSNWWASGTPA